MVNGVLFVVMGICLSIDRQLSSVGCWDSKMELLIAMGHLAKEMGQHGLLIWIALEMRPAFLTAILTMELDILVIGVGDTVKATLEFLAKVPTITIAKNRVMVNIE